MRSGMAWDAVGQDLEYAARALRSSPGFTLVAVAMLALGIGANTAIFSVVSAVLLKPLPFPEQERLVLVWENFTAIGGPPRSEVSPADYVSWTERSRSFTGLAAFVTDKYNLTGAGEPEKFTGVRATGNFFAVLGVQPLLGRTLVAADEQADAERVVVLDERLWRSRFGADPAVVGRTIRLNGLPRTVVGVVPADFRFPDNTALLWVPAQFSPEELGARASYYLYVLARLKPGVSLARARADMAGVAHQLGHDFPRTNSRMAVTVSALDEHLTREVRPVIGILFATVVLVLLIAGANLANLLLARGTTRLKEVAVRQALGATRGRVTRQLLTENAVIAAAGAMLGVALATPLLRYLARLIPTGLPEATAPTLDLRVLLFTAGVTVVTVLGFGTGPAFTAARMGLEAATRAGGRRGATASGNRLRRSLVVAELALTAVLVIAAGLLLRSYANVLDVNPGFDPRNLLVAETVLPPSKYAATERRNAFYTRVLDRVKALPGVAAAGFVNFPPFLLKGGRAFVLAEGELPPAPQDASRYMALDRVASPGYFRALGVPLIRGRDFDDRDAGSAGATAIVNRAMADLHWPGQDAIGRRLNFGSLSGAERWLTVVGVVEDVHQIGLESPVEPELYLPSSQGRDVSPFLWPQYLVVRTAGAGPLTLAAAVRNAVWSVDAEQAVSNIRAMEDVFDVELASRSTQLSLVGAFAGLALLMASLGLYGVLAYTVAQRLPEIGVRMALGAGRASVVVETVRGALLLAASGIVLGLVTALGATRALQALLFGVGPVDVSTFAGTAALLLVTALIASFVPAVRGASVDPCSVLRAE